jgi:hypothetical protein
MNSVLYAAFGTFLGFMIFKGQIMRTFTATGFTAWYARGQMNLEE